MPNTNQTLFIVIFSLLAVAIVLLTYVCWLKRMKMSTKRDLLYQQHQLERQQNEPAELTATQLQQLKPVLLNQLYNQDLQRVQQYNIYSSSDQAPQYTPRSNSTPDTSNNTSHSNNDILVNINDESERDATIIHTGQPRNNTTTTNTTNQPAHENPFI